MTFSSRPSPRPIEDPPGEESLERIAEWIRAEALSLGFSRAGIASPETDPAGNETFRSWLAEGLHGEMTWLADPDRVDRRADLRRSLPGVRSVVVVADRYGGDAPPGSPEDPESAIIARYARGRDYHTLIVPRLNELLARLRRHLGREVAGRAYSDTGPIAERGLARRAGMGWFGRNTMLIHPRHGSWELLGVLLLDLPLPPDDPFTREHCGRCRQCLDACPTGALLGHDDRGAPRMDAARCISYLTIELRGPIPRALRRPMGNRVFGCDICQEVCPWNGAGAASAGLAPNPVYEALPPLSDTELLPFTEWILGLSGKAFLRTFADSPLSRPRRAGLLRNLCVALGNAGKEDAVPLLARALDEPHPLVRGHAAWALGEIGGPVAMQALAARASSEKDPWVREEIDLAVGPASPGPFPEADTL